MATITIGGTLCAGGDHFSATVQLNAGQVRQTTYDTDELRATPTVEEIRDAVRVMLRAHMMNMTRAQAVAAIQGGITIVTGAA
jgi:hypothetical protein